MLALRRKTNLTELEYTDRLFPKGYFSRRSLLLARQCRHHFIYMLKPINW